MDSMNVLQIEKAIEEHTIEIRKLTRQLIFYTNKTINNETKNKTIKIKNRKT